MSKIAPTWEPDPADYQHVFAGQNPWRSTGIVPDALAREVERPLSQFLWQRILTNQPPRFQIILGPRRVGKSTAMYQTIRRLLKSGVPRNHVWWLRLDHPLLMPIRLDRLVNSILNTGQFTPDSPLYLFLDEITYAKEWDLWLKTFFDDRWPVRITGTSSATAALRERRLESGVGRWEEQYLSPYLFSEYLDLIGRSVELPMGDHLAETLSNCLIHKPEVSGLADARRRFLLVGGFPELLLDRASAETSEDNAVLESQRILRTDAVERAIYKDIPQTFSITEPLLLERLLYSLAGQFCGILSPQKLCQTLGGMSLPTFDRYLSYLERAFLVFTLPNYAGSEEARQKRGRKLYFVDSAVRNAALQRGIAPLGTPNEFGLLQENLVAAHLHALSQVSQVRAYHWRDKDDVVDLIYDHPDHPLAFEIAQSHDHSRSGLRALVQRFPRFRNRCYLVYPDAPLLPPRDDGRRNDPGTLPLDLLLIALGAQTRRAAVGRLGFPQSSPSSAPDPRPGPL